MDKATGKTLIAAQNQVVQAMGGPTLGGKAMPFDRRAPAMATDPSVRAGRFNALSGATSANFQKDLLLYNKQMVEDLAAIRRAEESKGGELSIGLPGY
jgi:hypothetical protein